MSSENYIPNEDNEIENLPSQEHCQKVVEEFVAITGTDEALAQFFLQEREWKLEQSVNDYYEAQRSSSTGIDVRNNVNDSDVAVTFDSVMRPMLSKFNANITTAPPEKFSILSWNLDGLDQHNLKKRTKAVIKIIELEKPDIVFLQEVIPATYTYMEDHLPGYLMLTGGTSDYFTTTLLYRMTVYLDEHTVHAFPGSVMDRNILSVACHIGSLNLRLFNSHLESTVEFSEERKAQLSQCFQLLKTGPSNKTAIFGGDLNIRDKEVAEVSLPANVKDLWELCDRRKECEFTWDTRRNTNKTMSGSYKPRLRFDRLYLLDSEPPSVSAVHFGLTGIQKVSGTQSFPSDHWGIVTHFKILNQKPSTSCSTVDSKHESIIDVSDEDDDCRLDGKSNEEECHNVIELD